MTAASDVAVLELTPAGLETITAGQPRVLDLLIDFANQREAELHRQGLLKGGE